MQPQSTTTTAAESALKGQPFGQIWDESRMTPGALRIIEHGRQLAAAEDAAAADKRVARNAKAKAARAAKKAAATTVVVADAPATIVDEPAWAAAEPMPAPPPPPAVIQHGNYRFQTATGRLKYGSVEITDDIREAGINVTASSLHRLPTSPTLIRRAGAFHLTPKAIAEFKRVA